MYRGQPDPSKKCKKQFIFAGPLQQNFELWPKARIFLVLEIFDFFLMKFLTFEKCFFSCCCLLLVVFVVCFWVRNKVLYIIIIIIIIIIILLLHTSVPLTK